MHPVSAHCNRLGCDIVISMADNKPNSENDALDRAKHQYRMRYDWHNLIDDLIQEGREDGVFDNLPGKGKPLKLNKNIYAADSELAHSLMKHNDLTPAWIMNRNHILEKLDALRAHMRRTWQRHEREFRLIEDACHRDSLTISWDNVCQKWQGEIDKLNKEINDFNLKRPIDRMELIKLNLESELKRVNAPRWLR